MQLFRCRCHLGWNCDLDKLFSFGKSPGWLKITSEVLTVLRVLPMVSVLLSIMVGFLDSLHVAGA